MLKRLYFFIGFIFIYLGKLIQANLYIAYDIISLRMHINPGFIRIPLILKSDTGLLLFSNLLSMTPGTLSIHIDNKKEVMLVHVLYRKNDKITISEIQKLQEKIKRIVE